MAKGKPKEQKPVAVEDMQDLSDAKKKMEQGTLDSHSEYDPA